MSVKPGQMLSHYRLEEKLGEGGMGVVWKATDTRLDREVAIKILPDLFANDPERMARFEREAKVLAALNHANIATIYGLERPSTGSAFLVMELVDGEDLAQRLARGPLPMDEALALAVQLAEALEAAHEQGIIHRDLKPANIKLTPDGKVKVLDFGLAKALSPEPADPSGSPSMSPTVTSAGTVAGMILGTAAYMSPEQAKGKPVDRRADIWAFGVVLHEMLTGKRLFHGESVSETLAAVIMGEPDLHQLPANTPRRVRRLIERSLRKDPLSRLRDMGDARLVLEESLAGHEWKTAGATAVDAGAATRRSPGWAAVLVVAGIVIGAVAGWIMFRPSSSSARPVTRVSIVAPEASVDVPWPVVSPDGKSIIFVGQEGGLYSRSLDRFEATLIRGTEGATGFPTFSPDGKWLAFVTDSTPAKLMKLPVDGSSPPVELAELPEPFFNPGVNPVIWPRGPFLLALTRRPVSLIRIPADGRPPEPAMELSDELAQNFLLLTGVLPDGRHVLAAGDTYGERGWQMNILALDTETGEGRVIVEDGVFAAWSPTGHLVFSRRDALLAVPFDEQRIEVQAGPVAILDGLRMPTPVVGGWFRFSNDGTLVYQTGVQQFTDQLVIVGRDGNVEPWSEDRRDFADRLAVSRDGNLLTAEVINWEEGLEEIWISEFDRPRLRPLVDEPGLDCSRPVLTPDADRVVYACGGGPANVGGIYMRRTDGTTPPELLLSRRSSEEYQFPTSISPDGSSLLIGRALGADAGLLLLELDSNGPAERQPSVLMSSGIDLLYGARFSPDGRWIVYHSDETGRREVYIRAFGADHSLGPSKLVSSGGGGGPVWAKTPPGRDLELIYRNAGKVLAVSIATSPEFRISEPRVLFDRRELRAELIESLPDGRLLIAQQEERQDEVAQFNVVLDWFEDLKRLARAPH